MSGWRILDFSFYGYNFEMDYWKVTWVRDWARGPADGPQLYQKSFDFFLMIFLYFLYFGSPKFIYMQLALLRFNRDFIPDLSVCSLYMNACAFVPQGLPLYALVLS